MNRYIDADELIAEIERRKEQPGITFRERNILVDIETSIARLRADMIISSLQQEKPVAIDGVVHHALNAYWIVVNQGQLTARLKQFSEGTEVEVFINERNGTENNHKLRDRH